MRSNQDVVRLQIEMQDVISVRGFHGSRHVGNDFEDSRRGEPVSTAIVPEIHPLNPFEHQIRTLLITPQINHTNEGFLLNRRQDLSFLD